MSVSFSVVPSTVAVAAGGPSSPIVGNLSKRAAYLATLVMRGSRKPVPYGKLLGLAPQAVGNGVKYYNTRLSLAQANAQATISAGGQLGPVTPSQQAALSAWSQVLGIPVPVCNTGHAANLALAAAGKRSAGNPLAMQAAYKLWLAAMVPAPQPTQGVLF